MMEAPDPLTLVRFTEISARMETGLSREEVLKGEQVSPEIWELTQETWLALMGTQAEQGKLGLQRRYAELFAIHQKKALLEQREAKRKLSGPMPVAPVARMASLPIAAPAKKAEEAPAPAPKAAFRVGSRTADISSVMAQVIASKGAMPFAGASATPRATIEPAKRAALLSGTADISAAVAQGMASKTATPFAASPPAARPPAAAEPMKTPAPVPPVHPFSKPAGAPLIDSAKSTGRAVPRVGSGTVADISDVVAQVMAGKAAMPFGGAAKAQDPAIVSPPTIETATPFAGAAKARDPAIVSPPMPRVGSGTVADISDVVAQVMAGKAATPFAGAAMAQDPAIVSPPTIVPAKSPAPRVGSETADISAVMAQLMAGKAATPFAGTTPKANAPSPRPPMPLAQPMAFKRAAPEAPQAPSAPIPAASGAVPSGQAPAGPALPPDLPHLSLEQYAELRMQLSVAPAHTAEILARWGVRDAPSWAALQWVWQHRFNRDPGLAQRWNEVVAQLKAARGIR